ncbi:MAG: hypothetical protein IJD35_01500 [Clostridia bacterium]|nr:hypothetical protein [Clostridia bacterium]
MRHQKLEKLSFGAMFLSLVLILFYLALAVESAREATVFWEHSYPAASLVAERAMKGLLLTALMGLGLDWYMKKSLSVTKN